MCVGGSHTSFAVASRSGAVRPIQHGRSSSAASTDVQTHTTCQESSLSVITANFQLAMVKDFSKKLITTYCYTFLKTEYLFEIMTSLIIHMSKSLDWFSAIVIPSFIMNKLFV